MSQPLATVFDFQVTPEGVVVIVDTSGVDVSDCGFEEQGGKPALRYGGYNADDPPTTGDADGNVVQVSREDYYRSVAREAALLVQGKMDSKSSKPQSVTALIGLNADELA